MKIGIEASAVFRSQKTGVGYYSYELAQALIKEMPEDEFLLCYISFLTRRPEKLNPSPENVRYRRISFLPGKIYNALDHYMVALPFDVLARARADVFIFPNFFLFPLWLCRKSIVVVHDLAYMEAPEYLVPRHRKYLSRRVKQSVRQASHVIAVSEHTKHRLIEQYGTHPDKITVVVPAIDHEQYRPAVPAAVKAAKTKYGISGDYVLFLGTLEPRKNITGIIKAYQQMPEDLKKQFQLVLAGGKGWLDEEIDELASMMPPQSLVRTGYVADEDKAALYTGATLFVYPSHYEGWGMQIPEAMACGTPMLTVRNSSLPEAGGEAVAYADSTDAGDVSKLMSTLLRDPARLAEMRAAGILRAKQFTWSNSAAVMAKVLKGLMRKAK